MQLGTSNPPHVQQCLFSLQWGCSVPAHTRCGVDARNAGGRVHLLSFVAWCMQHGPIVHAGTPQISNQPGTTGAHALRPAGCSPGDAGGGAAGQSHPACSCQEGSRRMTWQLLPPTPQLTQGTKVIMPWRRAARSLLRSRRRLSTCSGKGSQRWRSTVHMSFFVCCLA